MLIIAKEKGIKFKIKTTINNQKLFNERMRYFNRRSHFLIQQNGRLVEEGNC